MISVGILRHTLFAPSEPFIPDQVAALHGVARTLIARDPVVHARDDLDVSVVPWRSSMERKAYVLLRRSGRLKDLLAEKGVDLLHAHFGVEGMYSRSAAASAGIPHVTTLHGFDVTMNRGALLRSGRTSWIHYGFGRAAFLRSDSTFICVSERILKNAVMLGLREANAVVIPTGVDTDRLQPVPLTDAPKIVHVARLVEKKGTADLIRALAIVRQRLPEASLTIVGSGPLRSRLETLADDLSVNNAVRFLGAMPHPVALAEIASARVLAAPSVTARSGDAEGLGQVLLEAGALGRPVVATRHGGIPEAVVDGVTGLLVSEGSPRELAYALLQCLEAGAGEQLGQQGRSHVVGNFDVRTQASKVSALYRRII